jgi:hypothetical protein
MGGVWGRRLISSALFVAPIAFFGIRHERGDDRGLLPGRTSDGHHQIEQRCESCHTPFGGVAEEACVRCHGPSLSARRDSHAVAKFDDPGKAADLALVDARSCLTCHREHRPEARVRGSVTISQDFCWPCHKSVGVERPSHAGLGPATCAAASCHNYHDNRALHQDFLTRHRDQPALRAEPVLPARRAAVPAGGKAPTALAAVFPPVPDPLREKVDAEWEASAHGRAAVGCGDCHRAGAAPAAAAGGRAPWAVADETCASCHAAERAGFIAGKHGMRLAEKMPPMSPRFARAVMKPQAASRTLGCTSCHGAHRFDRVFAAVSACEGCHDDQHTRGYRASAHFAAWQDEQAGRAPAGSGVSCASCHLPREVHREKGADVARVQHNQNGNLRPTDRMVRDACRHCHGLGFSLAALADAPLVRANFNAPPGAVETGMTLITREGSDVPRRR